jgi:hypothetical protein
MYKGDYIDCAEIKKIGFAYYLAVPNRGSQNIKTRLKACLSNPAQPKPIIFTVEIMVPCPPLPMNTAHFTDHYMHS